MPAQAAPQSSTSGAPSQGFSEDLHPRGPGGRFANKGGGTGGKSAQGLSSNTRNLIAAYQKRHGLPVTGAPDAATISAAKRQANAPAEARKAKAAAKHAASVAKQATAKRVRVQKAAQRAITQRKHHEAVQLVSSVNALDAGQRATYRQAVGSGAPEGYAWTADNRLVTSDRAKAMAEVASKAGPATVKPKAKASAGGKTTSKAKSTGKTTTPRKSTPKAKPTPAVPPPKRPAQGKRTGTSTTRKDGAINVGSGTA